MANTLLFTRAKVIDISIWWMLLVEVVLFVSYIVVKSCFHPAQQLVKQGAIWGGPPQVPCGMNTVGETRC